MRRNEKLITFLRTNHHHHDPRLNHFRHLLSWQRQPSVVVGNNNLSLFARRQQQCDLKPAL